MSTFLMPHLRDMFLGKEILPASETSLVHAESKLRSNCKVLKSESSQRGLPAPLWWSETFARQVVFQAAQVCLKAVGSDVASVCHTGSVKITEPRTSALLNLNVKFCGAFWVVCIFYLTPLEFMSVRPMAKCSLQISRNGDHVLWSLSFPVCEPSEWYSP